MLLIDIHQFDVILAESVALAALEYQVDDVWRVFRLQREDVFVLSRAQDFRQGGQIDAEGDIAVTSKGGEHLGFEHHGYEGDVGVVHGLEGDAGVIAVEVAVLVKFVSQEREGADAADIPGPDL